MSLEETPVAPPVEADEPVLETQETIEAEAPETPVPSIWAMPLWEKAAWVALALAALLTRLWDLGARAMSHDESLHVYFSWLLATGKGYTHNPMMHGPFLFEATALFDRIFGANDFTGRLLPALMGMVLVVVAPFLLRGWLGRWGALAASVLLLVSPYVLFYSRYNRHDPLVIVWLVLAVAAILAYLRRPEENPLLALAALLGLMVATMEITFIYLAILASFLLVRMFVVRGFRWRALRASPEFDLLVVLSTLGAFFSSPIAVLALNPIWQKLNGQPFVDMTVLASQTMGWNVAPWGPRLWGLLAVFSVAAAAIGLWWGGVRWLKLLATFGVIVVPLFTTFFTNQSGFGTGFIGSLGYWLSQHSETRGAQPWYYFLIVFPLYEYLPILLGLISAGYFAAAWRRVSAASRVLVPLLVWWAVGISVGMSIAGEKMPWHSTHLTVPFILLSAWGAGQLIAALARRLREQDRPPLAPALGLAAVLALFALTIRTSYMVNYINYDMVTEFVGYAHGAPADKWVDEDMQTLAARLGTETFSVASDDDIAWPMSWYLREYPGFFGQTPSRQSLNAPVIVVGSSNWERVEKLVGQNYHRFEVIRLWWPMEDYKNLTWARIRGAITDPQMRAAIWDIIWKRDYTRYAGLTKQAMDVPWHWPLSDRMRIYIRKDIDTTGLRIDVEQARLPDLPAPVDMYSGLQRGLNPAQVIQPGTLNTPRNLALAPDGSLYVTDSGSSRIIKFDQSGKELLTWGRKTVEGENPPAPGTFNEPWGIAVDASGNVYVADTWNNRIQKFDANGAFLLEWGVGGTADQGPTAFWGPRAVAVGLDGRVYITDTGNKRVLVFDANGQFQFEFERAGEAALDEPVGIAIGPDGEVFVADTWNMRVAVFDLEGKYLRAWPVQAWDSDSLDNKPYIIVGTDGRVYVSDPENFRVIVFSASGVPVAVFGQQGSGEQASEALTIPNGLAPAPDGSLWVADAGANRLVRYPALP